MTHTPGKYRLWFISSAIYLALTVWVIIYGVTCDEWLCGRVMILPGFPWSLFFAFIYDELSLTGWIIATLTFAFLNIATLYIVLSEDKVVTPED